MAPVLQYDVIMGWSTQKRVGDDSAWLNYLPGDTVKAADIPRHVDVQSLINSGHISHHEGGSVVPAITSATNMEVTDNG